MKLLKFYADWCSPCTMLTKTLESIDHDLVKNMQNINVDEDLDSLSKYGVRGVPALILVDDTGKEVRRLSGYNNAAKVTEFLGQ